MSGAAPHRSEDRAAEIRVLRETLQELRSEIEARFPTRSGKRVDSGWARRLGEELARSVRERLERIDPSQLLEGLRRTVDSLWREESEPSVDVFGFDAAYLGRIRILLDFLYERWWRVSASGVENLTHDGPMIFVANRSGVLPYDGLMIAHAVEREQGPRPRFLVADGFATLPFSQALLARLGGVRASPENAERLLRVGQSVVVFPEGQKGALKPFRERYRLQRFGRGGFISLALRLDVPLVPVAVVGGEEVHPILYRPALPIRLLGVQLPITPTFPWLGPLGLVPLPSQWRIRFGEPLRWEASARARAEDALFVNRMRDRVRNTIQALLEDEVHRRAGVFRA